MSDDANLALELQKDDDDRLALAIKQYAIYLGEDETMTLYENWRKAESILSILTEAELMLSYCKEAPNRRINDSIELELLRRMSYAVEALNEIKSFFENSATTGETEQISHCRKGRGYICGVFAGIWLGSASLILTDNSQLPRVCLSRRLTEMRFLLISTRHKLLEPVVSSLSQRRGTKRKPRDTGTRALLQTALAAGKTPQDLAKMLVGQGLAGGLSGFNGSLKDEKARLNTLLSKLQKGR